MMPDALRRNVAARSNLWRYRLLKYVFGASAILYIVDSFAYS